nr:hypothetical protein [uncultured Methanoregula sp.]
MALTLIAATRKIRGWIEKQKILEQKSALLKQHPESEGYNTSK